MNHYLLLATLTLLPLGLAAQTKPAIRKPVGQTKKATAVHTTHKMATVPTRKATPAVVTPTKSTMPAPAIAQAQPVRTVPSANSRQATTTRLVTPVPSKASRFQIGVRVGGNLSTIGGMLTKAEAASVQVPRVAGFHGGLVVTIGGPMFSVQPEILFSQYGLRLSQGTEYAQFKYNLVEVPLLLKVSFGKPKLQFFVNAGPVATFAVSGAVSYRQAGQSGSQAINLTNQGRFAYGGSGGAGVSLRTGPGKVSIEGRYTYLLANQTDGSQTQPQNAMLSVGYLMPLGGR